MSSRKELIIIVSTTCVLLLFCAVVMIRQFAPPKMTTENIHAEMTPRGHKRKRGAASLDRRKERLRRKNGTRAKNVKKTIPSLSADEWSGMVEQLRQATNSQEKIDLINTLASVDSDEFTNLVSDLLKDKDKGVRRAAIESLNGKEKGDILKCVAYALDDPDKDVREMAVILISDAPEPKRCAELLLKATGDTSEDVRLATFDVLEGKPNSVQANVFEESIKSPYEDVKENTVEMLMNAPSVDTIEILFNGLDDGDPEFRKFVNTKIDLLFGRKFADSSKAMTWWLKNKKRFDKELFEKASN